MNYKISCSTDTIMSETYKMLLEKIGFKFSEPLFGDLSDGNRFTYWEILGDECYVTVNGLEDLDKITRMLKEYNYALGDLIINTVKKTILIYDGYIE